MRRRAAELTALDAAIGDGDHGINLERGFTAARERLLGVGEEGQPTAAALLRLTGQTLVSTVGGASGPLYGTFFLQLATELDETDLFEPDRVGTAIAAAVAAVGRRGRSSTGEKTMLDALVPAAKAWSDAAAAGGSLAASANAAHRAADVGRAATAPMIATKGRASYLGERSRGHVDPGATSATLLLGSLAAAIDQLAEGPGARR